MTHRPNWPGPPSAPGPPRVLHPLANGPDGLGEVAQVYARRAGRVHGDPLVYLPDGEAVAMRADARAGRLVCPIPDCPTPAFTTVGGRRRHHFRHLVSVRHASETIYHVVSKDRIAAWLRVAHPDAVLDVDESNLENGRRADVLATFPSGRRVAFEIQAAALTRDELARRQQAYRSLGVTDVWMWGPRYLALRLGASGAEERRPDARPVACRQALWLDPYAGTLYVAGPSHEALGGPSVRWGDVYAEALTSVKVGGQGLRSPVLDAARLAVVEETRTRVHAILAAERLQKELELAEAARVEWDRAARAAWRAFLADHQDFADPGPFLTRHLPSDSGVDLRPEHFHSLVFVHGIEGRLGEEIRSVDLIEELARVGVPGSGLARAVVDYLESLTPPARVLKRIGPDPDGRYRVIRTQAMLRAEDAASAQVRMRYEAERDRRARARRSMAPNPLPPVVGSDGKPWRPWPAPSIAELAHAADTAHAQVQPISRAPIGAEPEQETTPSDSAGSRPAVAEQVRLLDDETPIVPSP